MLSAGALVLLGASPSDRTRDKTEQHRSELTCGRSTLKAWTRWWLAADNDIPLVWLDQTIHLRREGARGAVALATEGHRGQRVTPEHSGLDAVVTSWACVRANSGASYLILGYGCGATDAERFCGGEREWFRLLDDTGKRLDAGFSRQDARYDALHARLGLTEVMAEGVRMHSVAFSD